MNDLFNEKYYIRNRIAAPNIKIYGNMEEVNVPFYNIENTEERKTVIRIYGWRDREMYKCKREDIVIWRFRPIPKRANFPFPYNERFEFEINGRLYTLKNKKLLQAANDGLQYEVFLDTNGRVNIGDGKYLIGQETYKISCELFAWNSRPNGVLARLWTHQGDEGREWYAFKEDIDECCEPPFEDIKREKISNREDEGNTYTYRICRTRPQCVYAVNFTTQGLRRCANPFEEDFVFRRSEGISVADGKYIRFKAGGSYYFIEREDINRVNLNSNINESGYARTLRYHALSLPFFTLAEASNDSLKCDIALLKRRLNMEISIENMRPGFVYGWEGRELYDKLNTLMVRYRSVWEYIESINITDYGYFNDETQDGRRKQEEYIKNQLWMNDRVNGLVGVGGREKRLYYFHPINFLESVCSEFKEINIERLKRVQNRVVALECLVPNEGNGMHGVAPKGSTFCNHAVYLTIQAVDGNYRQLIGNPRLYKYDNHAPSDIDYFVGDFKERHRGYRHKNSNIWCDILAEQALDSVNTGICRIEAEEAQKMANLGYAVIASWKNPGYGESNPPHYATVRPGHQYDPDNGPMIANVGGNNDIYRAKDPKSFGEEEFNEIKWYYNKYQDFICDTRKIETLERGGRV